MAESKVQKVAKGAAKTKVPCPVAGCDGEYIPSRWHGKTVKTIWFCNKCRYIGERYALV